MEYSFLNSLVTWFHIVCASASSWVWRQ